MPKLSLAQRTLVCMLLAASVCAEERAYAQPASHAPAIGVITFGRGDAIHQYFGHNAFVVDGTGADLPRPTVFNYGMFSFGPDMLPQFLKGRLRFWVGATDLQRTAASYMLAGRDVRVLELNLSEPARAAIFARLSHDVLPENREYLYDHYFDNCSTRVRDILDEALHGQLRRAWSVPSEFTLRDETRRYTHSDRLTQWLMMFGLSGSVDRPQTLWGNAFLPLELESMLDKVVYTDEAGRRVPLVAQRRSLFEAPRPPVPARPAREWPLLLLSALGAASCCIGLARGARERRRLFRPLLMLLAAVYGVAGGLLGSLVLYLATFSDHLVTHGNLNLLLLNPITLVAGFLALGALTRRAWFERALSQVWMALGASSLLLLSVKLLPLGVEQDVTQPAAVLAPLNLGFALSMYFLRHEARRPFRRLGARALDV